MLAADDDRAALLELTEVLDGLGHDVTALAVSATDAAVAIAERDPELALVRVRDDDERALALVGEIAAYASGPVIALLEAEDPELVAAAAEKGIFAYVRPLEAKRVQGAIEVALRRHADVDRLEEKVDQLETALERRAVIERAKGILMERHDVDDLAAFALLRDNARGRNAKVVDVARSVAAGRALLPRE
ncbi:MAG: ANTAR domain-containing protein [Actinomycetota bacterium]|nr:ANTAR domain-containing protein [Actinomycetota bacterium]